MPKSQRIQRKKRQVCIGDLDTMITLQNRNIVAPIFGAVDFNEDFKDKAEVWAAVNTVSGKTFFDGVSTDVNITHEVFIRYDEAVTAETWVALKNRRLDILMTENLDERSEFMKLICTDRGLASKAASKS